MIQLAAGEVERKITLDSITEDIHDLEAAFDECETEEELQVVMDAYLASEQDRLKKLDGYAQVITSALARAAFRTGEAKRLRELSQVDENKAKRMKERLVWYFDAEKITKPLQTPHYRISVQGNGGLAPLEIDELELGNEYRTWSCPGTAVALIANVVERMNGFDSSLSAERTLSLLEEALAMMECGQIDNTRIRKAIDAGEDVRGARLSERGRGIRIK